MRAHSKPIRQSVQGCDAGASALLKLEYRKFPPIAWNVQLAPSHYHFNGRGAREMCPNGGGPAVEELVPPMKPVVEELSTCFKHILLYYIRELIPPPPS